MANFLHRTTAQYLTSTSPNSLPEPIANYIEQPDLTAVDGFESKYWIITGDIVTLMSQAERDVVDVNDLSARRDNLANDIDRAETYSRAFALVLIDELNLRADITNEIFTAAAAANNLGSFKTAMAAIGNVPIRTPAQLKTALRNKLDG